MDKGVKTMKLNAKSLGLAGGILMGGMVFLMTVIAVVSGHGVTCLTGMMHVLPGYSITWIGAVIGLIYGFIKGFIMLYVLAFLYNLLDVE